MKRLNKTAVGLMLAGFSIYAISAQVNTNRNEINKAVLMTNIIGSNAEQSSMIIHSHGKEGPTVKAI